MQWRDKRWLWRNDRKRWRKKSGKDGAKKKMLKGSVGDLVNERQQRQRRIDWSEGSSLHRLRFTCCCSIKWIMIIFIAACDSKTFFSLFAFTVQCFCMHVVIVRFYCGAQPEVNPKTKTDIFNSTVNMTKHPFTYFSIGPIWIFAMKLNSVSDSLICAISKDLCSTFMHQWVLARRITLVRRT